jgi:tetratricopeptide (TPR) repeat protein
VNRHLAAARQLMGAGRTDLAAGELRAAIAQDPQDGAAHALLGLCLTNDGHHSEALAASDAALRLRPEDAFVWRVRSVIHLNLHRAQDAEAAGQRAIELDPRHAQGFVGRGQARLLAGRHEDALADFDTALSLDPEHAYAHDVRARTLTLMGRNDAAAEAAHQALRLAPGSATAHAARGMQLLHAGDREGAQTEYREALRLDPQSNWARLGLIEALKARNPVYRRLLRGLLLLQRSRGRAAQTGGRFSWTPLVVVVLIRAGLFDGITPTLRPLFIPAVALIYVAIVVAWSARPLFNALLRLSPDGRHLLSPQETHEANGVAACLGAGAVLGVLWAATGGTAFALAGASSTVLSLLVVVATFRTRAARMLWALGAASAGLMLAGLAAAVAYHHAGLPGQSLVPLMILAPIAATLMSTWAWGPARRRRRRTLRFPRRSGHGRQDPAPMPRRLAWPLLAIGLFAGMGLLGSLHGGARLGGGAVSAVAFAAAVVLPAARPVVRRARASSKSAGLVGLVGLGMAALGSGVAAVITRRVPVEGSFALALLLLAGYALVLGADSLSRRRRLAAWVTGCALVVVTCGAAALLGGHTHGPDSALTGPLGTWAGTGLFGLLLTPLLARIRRPRRLAARP